MGGDAKEEADRELTTPRNKSERPTGRCKKVEDLEQQTKTRATSERKVCWAPGWLRLLHIRLLFLAQRLSSSPMPSMEPTLKKREGG